jgi:glycine/D-amino acid oxidase-like deaminating enzyme
MSAPENAMRGPYHADLYDAARPVASWWEATTPAPAARPPLEGDAVAEVAIIGAGYAGLSCAAALAARGVEAVALDSGEIGWGASGRNGGIVGLGSDKLSVADIVGRWGEDGARAYFGAYVENARRLRALCAEEAVETQGDAEAYVAHCPRAFEGLKAGHGAERFGVEATLLDRDAYAERGYLGPEQHGALLVRPGFALHPLQLAQALARRAETAGARLLPRSEVVAWRREGGGHRLETARGSVRARRVVLATNGFTPDDLHPAFRARTMPVLSMIGVTRPLTEDERAAHAWREDAPLCSLRRMLYYFRMLPQGRLLFGMRGDLSGARDAEPELRARLANHIGRAFPNWGAIPLDHFWRGPVCMTRAYRPSIGATPDDPTVFHAFGWHGSGVNGATLGGRLLGEMIAGANAERIPAPMRGLPSRIPLPGLRRLWLGAWLAGYRARDWWDAR